MEGGKWNQTVLRVKRVKGETVNCGRGGKLADWRVNEEGGGRGRGEGRVLEAMG